MSRSTILPCRPLLRRAPGAAEEVSSSELISTEMLSRPKYRDGASFSPSRYSAPKLIKSFDEIIGEREESTRNFETQRKLISDSLIARRCNEVSDTLDRQDYFFFPSLIETEMTSLFSTFRLASVIVIDSRFPPKLSLCFPIGRPIFAYSSRAQSARAWRRGGDAHRNPISNRSDEQRERDVLEYNLLSVTSPCGLVADLR